MKILLFFGIFSCAFAATVQASSQDTYRKAGEIAIGGSGGWDYLSIDEGSHNLFLSHFDKVVVVDLLTNRVSGSVEKTSGVHGIAIAPELHKGFSSNGMEDTVTVFDLKTYKEIGKIAVGKKPDAILYIPTKKEVYVFNGNSHSYSVLDAEKNKVIGTYDLPGKPEFSVWDSAEKTVFVNIEDTNQLVAIDSDSHAVKNKWSLTGCESPSGLAIDLKDHFLFSVCENEQMIMTDGRTGKVLSLVKIGKGSDGVIFDPLKNLAISANGEGSLTVAQVKDGKLIKKMDVTTEVGARTIALDATTHKVYLPTAQFHPLKKDQHHAQPVDGTQKILVFAP